MPLYATSFFIPKSTSIPFILEDVWLKGGLRVVKDATTRDFLGTPFVAGDPNATPPTVDVPAVPATIPTSARKGGMLVVTADDNKLWQLQSDKVTWTEFKGGGGSLPTGVFPISVLVNGDVSIDNHYILPQTGKNGDFLVKDAGGNPAWQTVNFNGVSGTRVTGTYTTPGAVAAGTPFDFTLNMSQTIVLLIMAVNIPKLKLEGFSTIARTDTNPYTFISTPDILSDDGSTVMSDGTIVKGRRYNVLANLETPPLNIIYWRVTNLDALPVTPTFDFTYLILQ